MAIAVINLGSSAAPDFDDNVDRTSYANASWTPPTADNCIILLWVYNTRATNLGSAGSVSGNGLTWTQQATVGVDPGAQTHRLTCYAAISTGTASAGATTVNFSGDTQSSCIMEFQQVTGVDLTGGLAGAIIQEPTNSSSSATSLAVTLSAASDTDNRFFTGIGHGQPEGIGFEAGWDELDDINGSSPGHQLAVAWDSDSVADVTPSASWTTAGAALGIAIEVKAAPETNQTYEESVTIAKDVTVTDAAQLIFNPSSNLSNVKGVADSMTIDMFQDLAFAALKAIQQSAQADFNPTIGFQMVAGVDPSVIQNLNTTLGLGKLVGVTVVGQFVQLITKGYVITLDFTTNPVTVRDFRANSAGTDDFPGTNVEGSDS